MKAFFAWLILFIVLFGALSIAAHFYMTAHPGKIAIAFDDSYYMKDVWPKVAQFLKNIADRRYTEYFVLSNKEKISGTWEKKLDLGWFSQTRLFLDEYKLTDLVNTAKYPELKEADKIYVLTPEAVGPEIRNRRNVVVIPL